MNQTIGFIGMGNMGKAIAEGLLNAKYSSPEKMIASRRDAAALEQLKIRLNIRTTMDNTIVAREADTLFLAVKPDMYTVIIEEIRDFVKPGCIIVNMAAGKSMLDLEKTLGRDIKMVRIMPNTPVMVGEGMIAVSFNEALSTEEKLEMKKLFGCLGKAEVVSESLMDAVVGVSGSSPALMYMIVEAFADGAVQAGMPRKQAYVFAAQTMLGSAKMILETELHPGELKDQVTSPGGTTIDAVIKAEETGLRHSIMASVEAAVRKSKQMADFPIKE